MKRIIRVFPVRTNATPDDELVRIATTPSLFDEADEVHISVAFTWHRRWAEWAAKQWAHIAPVKIGGPAYNEPCGEFIPGMYLKKVIRLLPEVALTDVGFVPFLNEKEASSASCQLQMVGMFSTIIFSHVVPSTLTKYLPCWPDNRNGHISPVDWKPH